MRWPSMSGSRGPAAWARCPLIVRSTSRGCCNTRVCRVAEDPVALLNLRQGAVKAPHLLLCQVPCEVLAHSRLVLGGGSLEHLPSGLGDPGVRQPAVRPVGLPLDQSGTL